MTPFTLHAHEALVHGGVATRWWRSKAWTFVAAALVLVGLFGCDEDIARREQMRGRLVGTWSEDSASGQAVMRRVLALSADGKFTDRVVLSSPGTAPEQRVLAGEWSYDGTNLKRRYLQENGRQFSGGSMRYATSPLKSVSDAELVLEDTVQQREARYRRVAEGTQP